MTLPSGKEAGKLTSVSRLGGETLALAVLRDADLEGDPPLAADGAPLIARCPEWAAA